MTSRDLRFIKYDNMYGKLIRTTDCRIFSQIEWNDKMAVVQTRWKKVTEFRQKLTIAVAQLKYGFSVLFQLIMARLICSDSPMTTTATLCPWQIMQMRQEYISANIPPSGDPRKYQIGTKRVPKEYQIGYQKITKREPNWYYLPTLGDHS